MKKSVFRRSLVVPAVLLLGFGGTALAASPASAVGLPTATAVPSAAAAAPTAAATATATPTATATASPTATAVPTPAAKQPKDLTITSPNIDADESIAIHGSRTLVLKGSAPTGSVITLDDGWYGNRLKTITTTGTTFTLSVTFADDAPYDQFLVVGGKHGTTELTETYFDVIFDADTSATPTLDSPRDGASFEVAPLPFGLSTLAKPVTFSGTGTPGDDISLVFTTPGRTPDPTDFGLDDFGGAQADEIVVDDDGTWSGDAYVFYGDVEVSASQVLLGGKDSDDPVTVPSDLTDPIGLTMSVPAGTILPPTITTPAYDLEWSATSGTSSSSASSDTATIESGAGSTSTPAMKTALGLLRGATGGASASADTDTDFASANPAAAGFAHRQEVRARVAPKTVVGGEAAAKQLSVAKDDTADTGADDAADVTENGIQVKGKASAEAPGYLTTTVSGTGTPGQGIVLSLQPARDGEAYYAALYPALFKALDSSDDSSLFPTIPADPGTVTALLPKDDHSITVAADGTWTTTVTLKPGPYFFNAFQVAPAAAAKPTYSVAGALIPVDLTGTPLAASIAEVDPATQLAFTGSHSGPALAVGLGALFAGAGLLVVARRRRAL